jgi:CheY-like chemotaxis protein
MLKQNRKTMRKLLVIDDDKAIRKSFLLTFEDTDYTVDTVESGIDGIEKVKEENYDLIFLDLKMPVMNGLETLRHIREINRHIIVYIFTAFRKEYFNELEQALNKGLAFEIVQKPLDSEQLLLLVKTVLPQKN